MFSIRTLYLLWLWFSYLRSTTYHYLPILLLPACTEKKGWFLKGGGGDGEELFLLHTELSREDRKSIVEGWICLQREIYFNVYKGIFLKNPFILIKKNFLKGNSPTPPRIVSTAPRGASPPCTSCRWGASASCRNRASSSFSSRPSPALTSPPYSESRRRPCRWRAPGSACSASPWSWPSPPSPPSRRPTSPTSWTWPNRPDGRTQRRTGRKAAWEMKSYIYCNKFNSDGVTDTFILTARSRSEALMLLFKENVLLDWLCLVSAHPQSFKGQKVSKQHLPWKMHVNKTR